MNSKSRKLKDNIFRNIEKPYFAYLRNYGFPEDIEKKILEELYPEEIVVQVKERKIFDTNNDLIYHELSNGYYEEKALKQYIENTSNEANIFWYPHSGDDLIFLNEVIGLDGIKPGLIIMNDIFEHPLDFAHFDDWNVENQNNFNISNDEIAHSSMIKYNLIRQSSNERVNLLFLNGVDSDNLLKYFLECSISIQYIFTHRAAGGIQFNSLYELISSYFISDFHCIGDENIDGDNDLNELISYANRLGFSIKDHLTYPGNNQNSVLICQKNNI